MLGKCCDGRLYLPYLPTYLPMWIQFIEGERQNECNLNPSKVGPSLCFILGFLAQIETGG